MSITNPEMNPDVRPEPRFPFALYTSSFMVAIGVVIAGAGALLLLATFVADTSFTWIAAAAVLLGGVFTTAAGQLIQALLAIEENTRNVAERLATANEERKSHASAGR
jgi:hypothetical protein